MSKDGGDLLEWHSAGHSTAIESNSITKSLTNLAIGKLAGEGKVSLDEPVQHFFLEWMTGPKQAITLRHLLSHTSGLPFQAGARGLEGALAAELKTEPGTAFAYSNAGVDVLSGVVEYASGKRLDQYVSSQFFAPLEIKEFSWRLDEQGHALGSSGLSAHARDLGKIGQLLADRGVWRGTRLIASEWIAESTKPSQEFNLHSGLLWWLDGARFKTEADSLQYVGADGFSARGYNGQYLVVYPKSRLIGVRQIINEKHKLDSDDFKDFPKLLKDLNQRP